MSMRINISRSLIYLIYVCITIAALAGMWGIANMPPLFTIAMLFVICWYIRFMSNKIGGKAKLLNVVLIMTYLVAGAILIGYHSVGIPTAMFITIGSLMMMHVGILQKEFRCPVGMYVIVVVAAFVFEGAFYLTDEVYYGTARTLASWNPQSVGMWAYALGASLFILADNTHSVKVKLFLYAHTAFMIYISVITETRVVMGALVLLVITRVLPIIKALKYKWVAAMIALVPAVVSIGSVWLNTSIFNGRENIWRLGFIMAMQSPLIGNYSQYQSIYTHNIFVDHVLYYGYPFAICFAAILSWLLFNSAKYVKSRCQYTAYIATIGTILISSMEGAIFSGGSGGLFVYAFFCIYMMKSVDEKKGNVAVKKKILVW